MSNGFVDEPFGRNTDPQVSDLDHHGFQASNDDPFPKCVQIARRCPDDDMTDNFRIRRHDDVWAALILKYLIDKKDDGLTAGLPLIDHTKKADINGEILSEHFTNLIHRDLCDVVREAASDVRPGSYLEMYRETGENIKKIAGRNKYGIYDRVFSDLADKMIKWGKVFK